MVNKLVLKLRNLNIFLSTQRTEKLEFQDSYKITADSKEIEEKPLLNALLYYLEIENKSFIRRLKKLLAKILELCLKLFLKLLFNQRWEVEVVVVEEVTEVEEVTMEEIVEEWWINQFSAIFLNKLLLKLVTNFGLSRDQKDFPLTRCSLVLMSSITPVKAKSQLLDSVPLWTDSLQNMLLFLMLKKSWVKKSCTQLES